MGTTQQLLRAKNCTRNITFDKIIAIHNLGKLTDDKQSIATPLTCMNCFLLGAFQKFCNKKTAFLFYQECCFSVVCWFFQTVFAQSCVSIAFVCAFARICASSVAMQTVFNRGANCYWGGVAVFFLKICLRNKIKLIATKYTTMIPSVITGISGAMDAMIIIGKPNTIAGKFW